MRTKKFIYNIICSALYQALSLLFGLILPRLYIITYGSEINGLISSTVQFVSYFQYVEFGIGAVLIYELYKPLADNDYGKINGIITIAKKSYIKVSALYFLLVIVLALFYPLILSRDNIDLITTVLLIVVIGAYGALDFNTLAKYRVLLTADQRYYVVTIASIAALILNFVMTVALINLNVSIIIVRAVPLVTFWMRSLILRIYIKRQYPYLSYNTSIQLKVEKFRRSDALIFDLSTSLMTALPIIIVSIISLKLASVFSIYNMIFMGVTGILSVFTMGSSAFFGNVIADNDRETLIKINNEYEFSLCFIEALLFSTALALCIPFIKVYTKGIEDAVYTNYLYGVLFAIWCVIFNARLPQTAVVNGAGIYKETTHANIIQIIIFIVAAPILTIKMNIIGVLISMIIAAVYRTMDLIIVVDKFTIKKGISISMLRIGRIYAIVLLTFIPFVSFIKINCSTLSQWFAWAAIVFIWCAILTIAINLIFDRKVFIESVKTLTSIYQKKRS